MPQKPGPRRWRDKFKEAFRGVADGIRGQSSFRAHFVCAALAIVATIVLRCEWVEWCLVIGCIGLVLSAELLNSSIETLFKGLAQEAQDRVYPALDIAAGAVLVTCLTAAIVGGIVFGRRLLM
jgi:diacylglycerol kinase